MEGFNPSINDYMKGREFLSKLNSSDPYEVLLIAVYKQAVDDIICKYASAKDRNSAIQFLKSTDLGMKCLYYLKKEGYYNGE